MGIVLVALAVVIGAMEAGAASLMMLLREMFTVMLAQLGRLLFIGLCLLCLVIVLAVQLTRDGVSLTDGCPALHEGERAELALHVPLQVRGDEAGGVAAGDGGGGVGDVPLAVQERVEQHERLPRGVTEPGGRQPGTRLPRPRR